MYRQAIAAAIETSASNVRKWAQQGVWNTELPPVSPEQEKERRVDVLSLSDRMVELARAVREGSQVKFSHYETLRLQLAGLGAHMMMDDIVAIAAAFGNAEWLDATESKLDS